MLRAILISAIALALSSGGQATLYDRGGGLLYDDVLDMTWLQDANYARTSGYVAGGLLDWNAANTWASSLTISRFAGESLTGWQLPANVPVDADWNYNLSFDGTTDYAYNITSPASPISYMYYVNLGLKGYFSPTGVLQQDSSGVLGSGVTGGEADVGLVKNLQNMQYWQGTPYGLYPDVYSWVFDTYYGFQNFQNSAAGLYVYLYAWPVRPGDVVAVVPEPETYAMMVTALVLIGWRLRRKSQRSRASRLC